MGDGAATGAVAAADGVTASEADDVDTTHLLEVVVVDGTKAAAYGGLKMVCAPGMCASVGLGSGIENAAPCDVVGGKKDKSQYWQ